MHKVLLLFVASIALVGNTRASQAKADPAPATRRNGTPYVTPAEVPTLLAKLSAKDFNVRAAALNRLDYLLVPADGRHTQGLGDSKLLLALGKTRRVIVESLVNATKSFDSDASIFLEDPPDRLGRLDDLPTLNYRLALVNTLSMYCKIGVYSKADPDANEILFAGLNHKNRRIRQASIQAVGQLECDKSIPALVDIVRQLEGRDCDIAVRALLGVLSIEPGEKRRFDLRPYLPLFAGMLEAKDAEVRSAGCTLIKRIGSEAKDALPALRKCSQDGDLKLRLRAATALLRIPSEKEQAEEIIVKEMPALIEFLHDSNGRNIVFAAIILGELGAKAAPAVPKLLTAGRGFMWADPSATAQDAIRRIGPASVPALIILLTDPELRPLAINAFDLMDLGAKQKQIVIEVLAPFLQDGSKEIRRAAARSIGWHVKDHPGAVGCYLDLLESKDTDDSERAAILSEIENRGIYSARMLPLLKKWLRHEDKYLRLEAARMVAKLEPKNQDVAPALLEVAKSAIDAHERLEAARLLFGRDGHDKEALDIICTSVERDSKWSRRQALQLLVELGPAARAAEPTVAAALQDPEESVREMAAKALKSIRGKQ